MNKNISENSNYKILLKKIESIYNTHKTKAVKALNTEILQTYWKIGQYIVEFEQEGKLKAAYGKKLLIQLAKDLKIELGKGFSRSNLYQMRLFYIKYQKIQTVSGELS